MIYLSTNQDGSVAIITLFPVKIIRNSDGFEMDVLGQRREDPKGDQPGKCIIYGSVVVDGKTAGAEVVVGNETYDIADLAQDSIPGHTIVFPDVETQVIAKWADAARNKVASVRRLAKAEIPADRTFRNAWKDTGTLEVDMPKAREIHREKLRRLREPVLEQLDFDYMRADEAKDNAKKAQIAARKQALRDITDHPAIEAATTPEELKEAGLSMCW